MELRFVVAPCQVFDFSLVLLNIFETWVIPSLAIEDLDAIGVLRIAPWENFGSVLSHCCCSCSFDFSACAMRTTQVRVLRILRLLRLIRLMQLAPQDIERVARGASR